MRLITGLILCISWVGKHGRVKRGTRAQIVVLLLASSFVVILAPLLTGSHCEMQLTLIDLRLDKDHGNIVMRRAFNHDVFFVQDWKVMRSPVELYLKLSTEQA